MCTCQNCDQVHIDDLSADDNGIDLRFVHLLYNAAADQLLAASLQLIVFSAACHQKFSFSLSFLRAFILILSRISLKVADACEVSEKGLDLISSLV